MTLVFVSKLLYNDINYARFFYYAFNNRIVGLYGFYNSTLLFEDGWRVYVGAVSANETHFDDLYNFLDSLSEGDGLIISVESIVDNSISASFDLYSADHVQLSGTDWQSITLKVGDTMEYPYGKIQLLSVKISEIACIETCEKMNNYFHCGPTTAEIQNGNPLMDDNLKQIEFGPIQINEDNIAFQAKIQ